MPTQPYLSGHAIHKARRAALRGQPPPKRAGEIFLHELAAMSEAKEPLTRAGPVFPKRQLTCALMFLLREIEVADLTFHESTVSFAGDSALLHLPVSKMDIGGKRGSEDPPMLLHPPRRCSPGPGPRRPGDVGNSL